jgi:hypothetical protein
VRGAQVHMSVVVRDAWNNGNSTKNGNNRLLRHACRVVTLSGHTLKTQGRPAP